MPVQDWDAFDVLVVGELNMDLILNKVEGFPELGKEKIASEMNLTMGSSSAIFACNIARLGMETAFCGLVGNDDFGNTIVEQLQQMQVNTQWVQFDKNRQTGLTAIIRQQDDRAMVTYPGTMNYFSSSHIPDEAFQKARHLHLSSLFLQPKIKEELFTILARAKAHGMSISVDTQWDPAERWDIDWQRLFAAIDFFIPNEAEFKYITSSQTVEDGFTKIGAAARNCTIVVKCGKKGARYLQQQQSAAITGFPNSAVVDTVGAGDSFNAGLIYRYLQGAPLEQCIQFAALTGAVSTTQPGGTQAIKNLDTVKKIAQEKLSISHLNEFTK